MVQGVRSSYTQCVASVVFNSFRVVFLRLYPTGPGAVQAILDCPPPTPEVMAVGRQEEAASRAIPQCAGVDEIGRFLVQALIQPNRLLPVILLEDYIH